MNKKKQSPLDDEEFMVYELDYTGKRIKLDIKPEELQNYLNPERVLIIIIKKIFHRIYIWNGSESQLRKKIISSRVAQDIQRDLSQKDRDYKIISIDQGSEPSKFFEFLKRLFYQRTFSLCGKKGSGGNWAKGEYGEGKHGQHGQLF